MFEFKAVLNFNIEHFTQCFHKINRKLKKPYLFLFDELFLKLWLMAVSVITL